MNKEMKTGIVIVVLLLLCGCKGVPDGIKDAIKGNEKTIVENCEVWNLITKHGEPWGPLFEEHKKTCKKCEDIAGMQLHLRLRAQAHTVRAKKLVEWAEK